MSRPSLPRVAGLGVGVLATCISIAFASTASAQLLAYDGFGNGPLPSVAGSNGGTGWLGPWADAGATTTTSVSTSSLVFGNLETTPGSTVSGSSGTYPIAKYARVFTPPPQGTTTLYASFLMRANANFGSYGGISFGTYPYEMYCGSPLGMYSFGLMLSEGLGDISNIPLNQGQTYLVIVKISKNPAGPGVTYRLFVNPSVPGGEPPFPAAMYGTTQVNALPTAIKINNQGGFSTDEIRVGTTWQSVVPVPAPCLGDLNDDGVVDGADLSVLLGNWGLGAGDLNGDHTTNAADLSILLGAWGPCA